jgi:hypothetical protein
MAMWRVYNRHPEGLTHKEQYRDETIVIPAGQYVLMEYEEAVRFRGQYFPMKKNAQGAPDPAGFKVIHLEPHDKAEVPTAKEYICHMDGAKFPTEALLNNYLKQNYSEHATVKDENLDKEIETKKTAKGKSA